MNAIVKVYHGTKVFRILRRGRSCYSPECEWVLRIREHEVRRSRVNIYNEQSVRLLAGRTIARVAIHPILW